MREDVNGALFYDQELSDVKNLVAFSKPGQPSEDITDDGAQQDIQSLLKKVFSVKKSDDSGTALKSVADKNDVDFDSESYKENDAINLQNLYNKDGKLIMKQLKRSPEQLEADSLELHALIQERSKAEIQAVEEMSKHPLSAEQMREQIRRHHAAADRLEKRN